MKNQYFGDINDYKKYSLLRLLSGQGQIETAVCWVLTEDDDRTDGRRIKYLERPDIWRSYDPVVFEHLREYVLERGIRNVSHIEKDHILPKCRFYKESIYDDIDSRTRFLKKFLEFAQGSDLVFFDPDNGIEVKSIPRGKKSSSKYIYWDEVQSSYEAGYSLMIYQHFPRRPREPFLQSLVRRFGDFVTARRVVSFCTFHVVFLLIPQPRHEDMLLGNSDKVSETWGEVIKITKHKLARTVAAVV